MGLDEGRPPVQVPARPLILLDTHVLIWLDQAHPRANSLARGGRPMYISPATLLELQFLEESGRLRLPKGNPQVLAVDDRWVLDDPPAASWFAIALELSWTRDPFDRLIAAHARLRGWRLATADEVLLKGLGARHTVEL